MRPGEPLGSIWRSDRSLTALLLCLVVGMLVGLPLVAAGVLSPIFSDVAFGLILISGVASVAGRRSATALAAGFAVLSVLVRVVRLASSAPTLTLKIVDSVLSLIAVFILTGLVLIKVFQKGPITIHRVQGAVAAYLLLGAAWGYAYELAFLLGPGSIHFNESGATPVTLPIRLMYFSFVTLTTLGYGDIVPVHPAARSLAITEALVGQLYPAILIARLVSLEISSHRDRS